MTNARTKVYTVDVFDTCVTRSFAHPRDLFRELGLRYAHSGNNNTQWDKLAYQFQCRRIRAEKHAARLTEHLRAITIDDIYAQFDLPDWVGKTRADVLRDEIELERESIYAIPSMLKRLDALRCAGYRIAFISDMYLPSAILRPILVDCGVVKGNEPLYVSCDVGLSKHHGGLFRYVLEAKGMPASATHHVGDSLHDDIDMAVAAGMQAERVVDGMLNPMEQAIAGGRWRTRSRCRSLLAGFARRLRLASPRGLNCVDARLLTLACTVIVPTLLAYLIWVLDRAREDGVQRLYFVARDAEILYKMARVIEQGTGDLEFRYLYGSRRAWLPASIAFGSKVWRRSFVVSGQACSRFDLMSRLGLSEDQQRDLRTHLGLDTAAWNSPLGEGEALRFLDALEQNDDAARTVEQVVHESRHMTLAYLSQMGLADNVRWAMVDVGWSLNTQAAIKRLLDGCGVNHPTVMGYYLGFARGRLPLPDTGPARAMIAEAGSIFARCGVVVEHLFTASTHASTRGYQVEHGQVEPAFSDDPRTPEDLNYAKALHALALTGAKLVYENPELRQQLRACTPEILHTAGALLARPRNADAVAIGHLSAITDMRHAEGFSQPMCRPLGVRDLIAIFGITFSRRITFKPRPYVWLEGSIAVSPWYIRLPLQLMSCFAPAIRRFRALRP